MRCQHDALAKHGCRITLCYNSRFPSVKNVTVNICNNRNAISLHHLYVAIFSSTKRIQHSNNLISNNLKSYNLNRRAISFQKHSKPYDQLQFKIIAMTLSLITPLTRHPACGANYRRPHHSTVPIAFVVILLHLLFTLSSHADSTILLNTTGEPPLNTAEQTGFMDLVAKEAFGRIGITLRTVQLPAERGLKSANTGIIDGEMSRIAGLDKVYPNLLQVPEKIMDWEFVVFSKKAIDLHDGWNSLSPYAVSFINGWKILEKNVPVSADIEKVRTSKQLFTMIRKDRTDLIIYERWAGLLFLQSPDMHEVQLRRPPLAVRNMYIYLHQKHKALIPKLSQALAQMKSDGTYDRIVNLILIPLAQSVTNIQRSE